MQKRLKFLNTPPGSKPFYIEEAIFRNNIEKTLGSFFEKCGFFLIEPPLIDYFEPYYEIFKENDKDKSCIRFVNRDGDIVFLRNDITLFASKLIASRSSEKSKILRYYYSDSIIRSTKSFELEEYYQIGCEIVSSKLNSDFTSEEIKILLILIESLDLLGIKDFLLHIGDISFYQKILGNIEENDLSEILKFIRIRDFLKLEKRLKDLKIEPKDIEDCIKVAQFIGNLKELENITISEKNKKSLQVLINIGKRLYNLGYDQKIIFDMSELPYFSYYNGIIFHVYSKNVEVPIASGGRYDLLFDKLGVRKKAIGFSFWLYPLEKILSKNFKINSENKEVIKVDSDSDNDFALAIKKIKDKAIYIQYK